MSEIARALGTRIRDCRNKLGMSQEELAFKAGISAAHLGQIERAVKNPTIDTVEKIAVALNVAVPQLFRFEEAVSLQNSNSTSNKIVAQLSSLSESQQKDILKLIRIFRRFQNQEDE